MNKFTYYQHCESGLLLAYCEKAKVLLDFDIIECKWIYCGDSIKYFVTHGGVNKISSLKIRELTRKRLPSVSIKESKN